MTYLMHKLIKKGQSGISMQPLSGGLSDMQLQLNPMQQQQSSLLKIKGIGLGGLNGKLQSPIGSLSMNTLNALSTLIPEQELSDASKQNLVKGLDQGYDAAMAGVAMIPGVGTAISGIMGVNKLFSKGLDAIGVGTDKMTTADAILDSPFLKLSPFGLVNAIGAKRSDEFKGNDETNKQIGSSYQGSLQDFNDAESISNKKYGLFSRNRMHDANNQISEAQIKQNKMNNIAEDAYNDFAASNNPFLQNRMIINRTGGFQSTAIGQNGMKLIDNSSWSKKILQKIAVSQQTPSVYKNGGKMNIIPTGALHRELHHIDEENITKKGIPVVTKDSNGKIDQQAEIEREEIVYQKSVSEKLENLRDLFYKTNDIQYAIDAGKLIADETLHNTIDKNKLIKSIV